MAALLIELRLRSRQANSARKPSVTGSSGRADLGRKHCPNRPLVSPAL